MHFWRKFTKKFWFSIGKFDPTSYSIRYKFYHTCLFQPTRLLIFRTNSTIHVYLGYTFIRYSRVGCCLFSMCHFLMLKCTIQKLKNFVWGHYLPSESIYTLCIHLIMTNDGFKPVNLQFEKSFTYNALPTTFYFHLRIKRKQL